MSAEQALKTDQSGTIAGIRKDVESGRFTIDELAGRFHRPRRVVADALEERDVRDPSLVAGLEALDSEPKVDNEKPLNSGFVMTPTCEEMLSWLAYIDSERKLGLITGDAGTFKTSVATEYVRQHDNACYIVNHGGRRRVGQMLSVINSALGDWPGYPEVEAKFELAVHRCSRGNVVLILDESHLLSWDCLEIVRQVKDQSGCGVVLLGQPTTLDAMRLNASKAFLLDQLQSRIGLRRTIRVTRADVKVFAEARCGRIDKPSVDFLCGLSDHRGHIRNVAQVIDLVKKADAKSGRMSFNLASFQAAANFLGSQ